VPDLGLDRVLVRAFDPATSKLGDELLEIPTAAGAGPRHLAFSKDETLAFVINELDGTVLVARRNGRGDYLPAATAPALPAGFTGANTTAEIEPSPDERFVYASNRGHDSIVVFRREGERLIPIQHIPCGGKHPRHFKLSPCGKWLLCAHMNSNTISVLPRDPATGKLGEPTVTVPAPGAVCVLFYRKGGA
jgi:6-phosphogluconolactonase